MAMEEQMNMVEILSEELGQKELKIMALEKELKEQREDFETKIKKRMKEDLIYYIKKNQDFIDDGYEINSDDKSLWDELLEEMNENDWNEDNGYCELHIFGEEDDDITPCQFIIFIRMKECRECGEHSYDEDLILCERTQYICVDCHKKEIDSSSDDEDDSSSDDEDDKL